MERKCRKMKNCNSVGGLTPFGRWVKMQALTTDTELQEIARDVVTSKNYLSAILHGKRDGKKYRPLIIQRLGGNVNELKDIL